MEEENVNYQGLTPLMHFRGRVSSFSDYAAAGLGGAAFGATLTATGNPLLAGAAGGAAGNMVRQIGGNITGTQRGFNPTSFAVETTVSAGVSFAASAAGAYIANGFRTTPLQIVGSYARGAAPLSRSGSPFHVVYSSGSEAAHTGILMSSRPMAIQTFERYAAESYFKVSLPIANSEAAMASGYQALSCATGAGSAFIRGWSNTAGAYAGYAAASLK